MAGHLLAVVSSFIIATAATAAAESERKAIEVANADAQFNRALEAADINALRELITDTYVFTDPTGRISTKHDVIEGIASGHIRIRSQSTRDVKIDLYNTAAVETGVLTSVAVRDGRNTGGLSASLVFG